MRRAHLTRCDVARGVVDSYEIRVRGRVGPQVRQHFPDLIAVADGRETVLVGPVRDQSELHSLLALIEAVGLELIEVRRDPGGGRS